MRKQYFVSLLFLILIMGCAGLSDNVKPHKAFMSLDEIRTSANEQAEEMVRFLSKSVQYESVEEYGYELTPETQALMTYVLNTARKMGFSVHRAVNGMVGVLEYGQGQDSAGVLIHLDVVPVAKEELSQWTYPPFSGKVTDKAVWGRGAQDDKGALASVLWGAKILIDNKVTFKRKLKIILGTKEEKNFEAMTAFFKEFPQKIYGPTFGFVPDGAFISQGEKGIADIDFSFHGLSEPKNASLRDSIVDWNGGSAVNTVPLFSYAVIKSQDVAKTRMELLDLIKQVTQELSTGKSKLVYGVNKAYEANLGVMDFQAFVDKYSPEKISMGDLVLFSKGKSAHGASPWLGKNAIVEVALVASRMAQLSENAYKRASQFVTSKIGLSTGGQGLGIPFKKSSKLPPVPPQMISTYYLGTSANLGLIKPRPGNNKLVLSIDFRTGFENTNDEILESSKTSVAEFQGTADYVEGVGSHYDPFYFTREHPLLRLMIDSYKETYPDYPPYTPYVFLTPATTYLKLVSNFVNFGPVDLYPDFTANYFHEKDERTLIKSQVDNVILYAHTLQKMVQMENPPVK